MCAARGDRAAEAMPYQQAEIDRQKHGSTMPRSTYPTRRRWESTNH